MENRFTSIMTERSNEELMEILLRRRNDYQSEAVDAARSELKRRNLSQQQFEEITDLIQLREEQERKKQEDRQSWFESRKNYFKVPSDLPVYVRLGAWLIYLSLLLDVLRVFLLNYHGIIYSSPDVPAILATLIYLFITYMIHTGKNWARLLFVTFLFTHLLLYPFYLESGFQTGIIVGFLITASLSVRLLALALLFSKSAKNWYRRKHGTVETLKNLQLRKPVMALIIAILFGAYMFRPIIMYFYELKTYSLWLTMLIILVDLILLILIFFLWYGYLRREFSRESG
ncbi:MAG: hypothetical protein K9H65_05080 [Bacteroidales bacterium]|nr:hypothetical protein [Bacteroidales bacterium]